MLLGLIAPFVSVGAYRGQIQKLLELSLGRPVMLGKTSFTLFSGPGFSIEGVTIGEDPRYGIEPCAYVPTLIARIRVEKLLLGRIELAELRLIEPTLNLVKQSNGDWNILDILQRLGSRNSFSGRFLPAVEISDARLNFKLGLRKTLLYVDNANVAAYPEASGKVRVRFEGSPFRSDRSGHGFGVIRGSANWYLKPPAANANKLEADLILERTDLSETTALIEGYDVGVHGAVSSRLSVSGPENALAINGDLRLENVHRWDLLSASGEDWHVQFQGLVDLAQQKAQLETLRSGLNGAVPVVLQVKANNFLKQPLWSVLAQLQQAPAQNLLPLAARLGLNFPAGLTATGNVDGVVGYSNRSGWNGGLALNQVQASLPQSTVLDFPATVLSIINDHVHVFPSEVRTKTGLAGQVTGDYLVSSRLLSFALNLAGSPVDSLNQILGSWFNAPPLLSALQNGTISGTLRYHAKAAAEALWNGDLQLTKGLLRAPGLAVPVRDLSARLSLANLQVDVPRFSAMVAGTPVGGEYHYNPAAARKERIRLQVGALNLAEIEHAFSASLTPQDFLSRLRWSRRAVPAWLADRNLEADVSVNHLLSDGVDFGALKGRFFWSGPAVQIAALQIVLPQGHLRAQGSITLSSGHPRYQISGSLSDYPFKNGLLDVSGHLETSGEGEQALANLQASGEFSGKDINAAPDVTFSKLTGNYTLTFAPGWPSLSLTDLQAEQAEETWQGSGTSDKTGALVLDLVNGTRQMRVLSTIDASAKPAGPVSAAIGK